MAQKLPITLAADSALLTQFKLTKNALEHIEAWLNFETLKANWYADETKVIQLSITLISEAQFVQLFRKMEDSDWLINLNSLVATCFKHYKKNHIMIAYNQANVADIINNQTFEKQTQVKLTAVLNALASNYRLDLLPVSID